MIDEEFLKTKGVDPQKVPQIQEEIMLDLKNENFDKIKQKYDSDAIEHLCHDLVEQGKIYTTGRVTLHGIQPQYGIE